VRDSRRRPVRFQNLRFVNLVVGPIASGLVTRATKVEAVSHFEVTVRTATASVDPADREDNTARDRVIAAAARLREPCPPGWRGVTAPAANGRSDQSEVKSQKSKVRSGVRR
jgi:hypothetical protein